MQMQFTSKQKKCGMTEANWFYANDQLDFTMNHKLLLDLNGYSLVDVDYIQFKNAIIAITLLSEVFTDTPFN